MNDENFHLCQTGETFFFFLNMKISAKRQRNPNYVEQHAWAIVECDQFTEGKNTWETSEENSEDPSYIYNTKVSYQKMTARFSTKLNSTCLS